MPPTSDMERSADDKSLWISPETHSEILRTEKKLSTQRKRAAENWRIRAEEAEKEAEELRGQLRHGTQIFRFGRFKLNFAKVKNHTVFNI